MRAQRPDATGRLLWAGCQAGGLFPIFVLCLVLCTVISSPRPAAAIDRSEALQRALAYEEHVWHCSEANRHASCSSDWECQFQVGDYEGLPYDWGGYIELADFDREIADGAGAGSLPSDGVLDCTVGVDCSGYVSKIWRAGHHGTATFYQVTKEIDADEVLPADAFNWPSHHIMLWVGERDDGTPTLYESVPMQVRFNRNSSWSYLASYTPVRYKDISGPTATPGAGTPSSPYSLSPVPFIEARDTRQATSRIWDHYSCAPDTDESGPEYVYRFEATTSGRLIADVFVSGETDVDLHLLSSASPDSCLARDDVRIDQRLAAGTYLLAVDSYVRSGGEVRAGPYSLMVHFQPGAPPPPPDGARRDASADAAPADAGPPPDTGSDDAAAEDAMTPGDAIGDWTGGEGGPGDGSGGCSCALGTSHRGKTQSVAGRLLALALALACHWTRARRAPGAARQRRQPRLP